MEGANFKKLNGQDLGHLIDLLKIYEDVFEMRDFKSPDSNYLVSLLSDNKIIFYVAIVDDKVVGGLTAYILPSVYFPSSEVYIYDLAVISEYRRRGIGKELLAALKDYCIIMQVKEIFVQADLEDQHAIDFYNATGGKPERVVHFTYDMKQQ